MAGISGINLFRVNPHRTGSIVTARPHCGLALVPAYLVLGFLMKPVFMKLGQRHEVLTPDLPRAASSSVRALWKPTAANLLELKERGLQVNSRTLWSYRWGSSSDQQRGTPRHGPGVDLVGQSHTKVNS